MTLRRRAGAAVVGIALAVVLPAVALAHPLGNFTVNHYAGIRVEPERVLLDVVVDQAEIPTFQEKLRIDTDGDGSVSDAEAEAERVAACPVMAPSLSLSVAGTPLHLRAVEAGLSFPPGAAGMETMRLVCVYLAELPGPLAPGSAIAFADTSGAGRIGWREITAVGSGVTLAPGSPPVSSVSARLTAYPAALIPKPLDIRSASFEVSLGGPVLAPFSVPDAAALPGAASLAPSVGDDADPVAAGPSTMSGAVGGAGAGSRAATAATARRRRPGWGRQRDLGPARAA